MFELGICRLDQYRESTPSSFTGIPKSTYRNRVSYQLFRATYPASPKQVALFEQAMPHVLLSSGIYRTTFRQRFRQMDVFLNTLLHRHIDAARHIHIHDWAASDCLASCEWARSLLEEFPNARMTASDLTLFFIEALLSSGEAFIMETGGELIQYVRPPFVISINPPEPKLLIVNRLLAIVARAKFRRLQRVWTLPEEWLVSETAEDLAQPPFVFRKIPLVHPEAEALRRSCDRFTIRRHSVFEPLPQPCDVIRTMNIYNPGNFSREHLLEGVRAVWLSLLPSGLWILGRSCEQDATAQNVSVLVREVGGFRLLDRLGKGSEIEDLVLTGCAQYSA